MKIGVDATSWQNNRGYGRHARALLRALAEIDRENEYTFFMDSEELLNLVPSGCEVRRLSSSAATAVAASANGNRSLQDMWRVGRAMSSSEFQVLLFPTIYSFVPTWTRARRIVVVHDTIAETYPELTLPSRKARLFWQAKVRLGRAQADALVTVSEYSRQAIVKRFGIPADRIFVVSEAADPVFRRIPDAQPTAGLRALGIERGQPMVVYVGGFSPHKNLEALIEAFARLGRREARLVLVGEYKKEVFHSYYSIVAARVKELGIADRVIFTGYLPDADLAVLLNIARVLALPSFMEGFGLPAVEAAACGCPVVATVESPLPSLLEGGGIFIDPRGADLGPAIEAVLGDSRRRDALATVAAAKAQELTWQAAARQMLGVIQGCGR